MSRARVVVLASALALVLVACVPPTNPGDPKLPGNCVERDTTVRCTFAYNGKDGTDGSPQSFVVPSGVHAVTIDAYGAQGGGDGSGLGGHARGTFPFVAGTVLHIRVGGSPTTELGGFNGGGAGTAGTLGNGPAPAAGGGASDVRVGGDAPADRVVVAGGGGGAGQFLDGEAIFQTQLAGGDGGGASGHDGTCLVGIPYGTSYDACGHGGASATGGAAGTSKCENDYVIVNLTDAEPGTAGDGGSGASITCIYRNVVTTSITGAGGGGGWFGGGGGGAQLDGALLRAVYGSGGGGSGFVSPSATGIANDAAVQSANGTVFISYSS